MDIRSGGHMDKKLIPIFTDPAQQQINGFIEIALGDGPKESSLSGSFQGREVQPIKNSFNPTEQKVKKQAGVHL